MSMRTQLTSLSAAALLCVGVATAHRQPREHLALGAGEINLFTRIMLEIVTAKSESISDA